MDRPTVIKCECEPLARCACRDAVVCLKHATFSRGPKVILSDVTFCIDSGIFLGVIGPNGGGKTTLLKLILGVLRPGGGTVRVFGHDPSGGRDFRGDHARIGYVPQRHEIDRNFPATALDVVMMGAAARAGLFRRVPAGTADRARELLGRVGVGDLADRPIGRLSGGQQQRVFIARALVTEPRLLVLDEPTVGIDSTGQIQFLHLIRDLKSELGLTVVMVSHDVGQLAHYADQMACVNGGLHWHDRAALLTREVLDDVYGLPWGTDPGAPCEVEAYRARVRDEIGG